MQILQHTFPVAPGLVAQVAVRLVQNGKVNQGSFNFINKVEQNIDNQPIHTEPLVVSIEASPDGLNNWAVIQSPFTVPGGGQLTKTVVLPTNYIRIKAKGSTGKGGYARLHLSYEGMQDQGQIEVMTIGKQGYAFDGGTGQGQVTAPPPGYPEGDFVEAEESSSSSSSQNSSSSSSRSSASSASSASSVNSSSSSSSSVNSSSSSSSSSKSSASSGSSSSSSSTSF